MLAKSSATGITGGSELPELMWLLGLKPVPFVKQQVL